jgi:hypothetical protein
LGHADSIERLLPKLLGCQHNLFVPRVLGSGFFQDRRFERAAFS